MVVFGFFCLGLSSRKHAHITGTRRAGCFLEAFSFLSSLRSSHNRAQFAELFTFPISDIAIQLLQSCNGAWITMSAEKHDFSALAMVPR